MEAEDGQSTLNEMNQESKWLFIKKIFMASKKIYSNKENVKVDKFDNDLEFPIEEDAINLGVWLQLNHPNFFDGSL